MKNEIKPDQVRIDPRSGEEYTVVRRAEVPKRKGNPYWVVQSESTKQLTIDRTGTGVIEEADLLKWALLPKNEEEYVMNALIIAEAAEQDMYKALSRFASANEAAAFLSGFLSGLIQNVVDGKIPVEDGLLPFDAEYDGALQNKDRYSCAIVLLERAIKYAAGRSDAE